MDKTNKIALTIGTAAIIAGPAAFLIGTRFAAGFKRSPKTVKATVGNPIPNPSN